MTLAVETHQLVKSYGATRAVDGVSLAVAQGTIYGVLGPNGAGKTTTVRVLATLLPYEGGEAKVLGHDVTREAGEVRKKISLTGQYASVDEDLTAFENLVLLGRLLGLGRARAKGRATDLIEAFDLVEPAKRQVKTFSGGQRRRLDIAASIVVTPDLLFLDEPTTGLDPRSRNDVWELIRTLVSGGTTVLLTTQYLEEADQLADRIAVIDHGKVIAEGTSDELKRSVGAGALRIRLADVAQRDQALALLRKLELPLEPETDLRALKARLPQGVDAVQAVRDLQAAGIVLSEFSLGQPSLDEVFFALTGHGAVPEEKKS